MPRRVVVADRREDIRALAERFTYDLGLCIAGHRPDFTDYMSAELNDWLYAGAEPILAMGDAMRPNFGEYGELRIEGPMPDGPFVCHIRCDLHSRRELASGLLMPADRQQAEIEMIVAGYPPRIEDFQLRPWSPLVPTDHWTA